MSEPRFLPLVFHEHPVEEMWARARGFYEEANRRRTVREFDSRPVPREIIEDCLRAAGTAPSGANLQPWHFVAVSDPAIKRRIREAAESEESRFYNERAPADWLAALAPLGTDEHKPFLEDASWLIVVFGRQYEVRPTGEKVKHYYVQESVGIATGLLIAAIHRAGLASLTHTPSPMGFLNAVLERPRNERPFLILVVGYPAPRARVPDIRRRPLEEIASFR